MDELKVEVTVFSSSVIPSIPSFTQRAGIIHTHTHMYTHTHIYIYLSIPQYNIDIPLLQRRSFNISQLIISEPSLTWLLDFQRA